MNIAICGGGNLGHVCIGVLGADSRNKVSLLTSRPTQWGQKITVSDVDGKTYEGCVSKCSDQASQIVNDADLVLLCLPGYAIHEVLRNIAPFLPKKCIVGAVVSSTGFFFEAFKILPPDQPLFGFQRVPFISRTTQYGHSAELKGYKPLLRIAVEQADNREAIRQTVEHLFATPTELLSSYYEVSLSNSNPLLHTSRLYTMWKDWQPGITYERNPYFYAEWTEQAASLYIDMDVEFQKLLRTIGLKDGSIPSVLDYYDSTDAKSLTQKISTIPAFQGILSPMTQNANGRFLPDFHSRYFTEDFPYGMRFIVETAEKYHQPTPLIREVYSWGIEKIECFSQHK